MPDLLVHGHLLEYEHQPPAHPGSPTIVFLHDGLGSAASWRNLPATLAAATGCGTLAYSRLGYGASGRRPRPWPSTFLHDEARLDLPAVLLALELRRVILFGHSDGGSIALIAAALNSALLAAVIVEAAHVIVEPETIAGIRRTRTAYDEGTLQRGLSRLHGSRAPEVFDGWSEIWLSEGFRHWTIEPLLPTISCPVLALQGEDDDFATPAHLARLAGLCGGHTESWLVPACGHAPHREQPGAVTARVLAFLDTVRGIASTRR